MQALPVPALSDLCQWSLLPWVTPPGAAAGAHSQCSLFTVPPCSCSGPGHSTPAHPKGSAGRTVSYHPCIHLVLGVRKKGTALHLPGHSEYSMFLCITGMKELDIPAEKGLQTQGSISQMLQSEANAEAKAPSEHQLCVCRPTVELSSRNAPQNALYNHLCSLISRD